MTDVERILSMSFEDQDADFRRRVIARYGPEEAERLLDPGPEETIDDLGPTWRERLQDQAWLEHLHDQEDRRAVMRGIG